MTKNIKLIYVISALMWGRFFVPVLALFYIASQVSLKEFGIILGVFSATIMLLEIPSGILADRIGKKKTLLISRFLYLIEVVLLAFTNGFLIFLIAKILSGIAVSLTSGTSQALLYDSVKKYGQEHEFKKIFGIQKLISYTSMGFVFVIGSYLFSINSKLPAIASLPLLFLGFILTFFIEEPHPSENKNTHIFEYFKKGVDLFRTHPQLLILLLISIPSFVINEVILTNSSVYFITISVPVAAIGSINFFINIFAAQSSKHSENILSFFNNNIVFLVLFSILICLLLGFSIPYLGVLFFFIVAGIVALLDIFLEDSFNKKIVSKYRATSLSIKNMIINLGLFFGYMIFGFSSINSLETGFFILAIISFVFVCAVYFFNFHLRKKERVFR